MSASAPFVALAAGGTGGHMFPAEALAQELSRRGCRLALVTDARGERYADAIPADEKFLISAATPSIGGVAAKAAAGVSIAKGLFTALRVFRRIKPAAAVGFGGYPSLPAMKAAALLNIPYGVHEQNGVLGRANRLLVRQAAFTAHAFPVLEKLPNNVKAVEVGNPVRDAVAALADAPAPRLDMAGDINLLIFGGSQGASIFADAPVKAIAALSDGLRRRLMVVHQAREADLASVRGAYQSAGVRAEVAPFFKDLPARMAAAHLVVSRAGASTVTELATIGRASILAPLAIAMDDHQTLNASVLSRASAAIVLPESQFNEQSLRSAFETLFANTARLHSMSEAAKGCVKAGAAAALADLVETLTARTAARRSSAA